MQQLKTTLFPPRNMEDAEVLATGGNTAVPFLVYRKELKENEAASCIRALRLIGTFQARQALRGYLGDRRETVISELARAVNPLEIGWVQELLLAGKQLPEGIVSQVVDLSPLAGLTDLKTLILSRTQVVDLSPLAGLTNLQLLFLNRTPVVDLSPLAGLSNLLWLDVSGTRARNLDVLKHLHCHITS